MLFILPPAPSLLFHVMERGRKPCQLSDTTINTVAAVFFSSPHPTPTKRPVFVARCMVTKREEVKQNSPHSTWIPMCFHRRIDPM